ncbi:MAG TPA: uroporphyrinogen-III C-methyltransferase [Chitinispirillaceae bacterium]|nr:uroporphyrinogen-III C-methyltransferase [Chitinispirillaceae bacterium]
MIKQNTNSKKHTERGIVYLVGAGPGDPGLISIRGNELLHSCDVVIYDALVNETLVATLPDTTIKIFAGKRGNKPSTPQNAINKMLFTHAKKGKSVVRLKGGDPLLFGRGSEEMEFLREKGIDFVVVPGITSAIAAPAWAGIPVTHRSVSRSVAIVTGHLQAGESIEQLSIPVADTIVFLMAMQNLSALVQRILSGGIFTKKTPASIVQNGTLPDQKVICGTLATIEKLKVRHHIESPAVFIVGETAMFARNLSWYAAPPLAGRRVIVLRTPEQSDELLKALHDSGATAVPWPIIKIKPRLRSLASLTASYLAKFTMVIFTSPNGVRLFMETLLDKGIDSRHLAGKKVYTLGGGTAAVLKKYGIIPDCVPKKFVAEELLSIIPESLHGERILVPRASVARTILIDTLKERGADVAEFSVYDTVGTNPDYCPVQDGDYVLFTSSSTAEHFFSNHLCKDKKIIPCCIGDITSATVRKYFGGSIHTAQNASIPAMIEVLKKVATAGSGKKNG